MRMHANYGGLLKRGQIAREEDQQDVVALDETQAAATNGEVPEAETPAEVSTDIQPEDTAAVPEVPAEGEGFVAAVNDETPVETSAVEDGIVAGDVSAADATVDAVMDVDPATVEASGEIDGDNLMDVPAETVEDAVAEVPTVDAETEAAVDATLDVAVNTTDAVEDTAGEVTTEVPSESEFDAGTDAGADAAADASAAADVTDGIDATADAVSTTAEQDIDPATLDDDAGVDSNPEVDVAADAATDATTETTNEETPAVDAGEQAASDPLTSEEAADTVAEAAQTETEAEVPGADIDVGTAEGGATGEAGLTEEVAVNDGETEEVAPIEGTPEEERTEYLPDEDITEADSDMDGVNAYDADITDMNDEVDDATDAAQELEMVVESLRIAADNGGLDRNGAMFMNMHVQSIYKKVPGMGTKSQRMSLEAFSSTAVSKVDGTQLAMEEVKSNLRKIVDQIIEMIRKGAEFIKQALLKYFDEASALHAKAKALLELAGKVKGQPTASEITNVGIAHNLGLPGKAFNMEEACRIFSKQSNCLSNSEQQGGIGAALLFIGSIKDKGLGELSGIGQYLGKGEKVDAAVVGISDPGEGMQVWREEALPGNRCIVNVVPVNKDASVENVSNTKIRLATYDTSYVSPQKNTIPVMSLGESTDAIKLAIEVLRKIISYNSKLRVIDKTKADLIAAVKSVSQAENVGQNMSQALGHQTQGEVMTETQAASLAKTAAGLIDQPAASFIPYALTTCRGILEYAHKSLAAHGATEATA